MLAARDGHMDNKAVEYKEYMAESDTMEDNTSLLVIPCHTPDNNA